MSTSTPVATVEAVIKVEVNASLEEIREFYGLDSTSTPTGPLIAAYFKHRGARTLREELTITNPKGHKITLSTGTVTVIEPKSSITTPKRKSAKGGS